MATTGGGGGGGKPPRGKRAAGPSGTQRAAASVTPGEPAAPREAAPSTWREARGRVDLACMRVILARRAAVRANNYNPNSVPPDRLELLAQSIADNGFCFPVVVIRDEEASAAEGADVYVIVDGFHRWTVAGSEWLDMELVPVVVLGHTMAQRLAATWQFNKARGSHRVDLDADLVRALLQQGLTDAEVCAHLGVDPDTVHRYKQTAGIADIFRAVTYSPAWTMVDDDPDVTERGAG